MRARGPALGLMVLMLGLALTAAAQELSLSVGAGGLFPKEGKYREIYGSGLSFGGDVWFKLKGRLGFAAGFGSVSDKGTALQDGFGTAVYPLSFQRTSVPVIAFYQLDAGPVVVRFGAGAGFHSYKETWTTVAQDGVNLHYDGRKISSRFVMTASLALISRISLFCSASYDTIRAGAGSALATTVDIGGLQLLGGLAFRIF